MTTGIGSLGHRMAAGAGWLILLRILERSIGVLSTLILVRVLVPDDFGLVAMAMSLMALIEALGSFGLDMALIRNRQATRDHYDTVWSINLLFGIASGVTLCVAALPMSAFYSEPRLAEVVLFLGVIAMLGGLENVGIVDFQKELRFDREFVFRLAKKLVGFTVTISLALALRNYWALLFGSAAVRLFGVGLSYAIHPFRPRFGLSRARELWRFSMSMWISNATVFAAVRGYDFIVGKICGTRALGLYSVSYEVATLPTTELVDPIARALFPGFASISRDPVSLKRNVLGSAALIAAFTLPLGVGLMMLAEPTVSLLLGTRWIDAIPVVTALAVYGVMRAAHAGSGTAYVALGHPNVITWINLPHVIVGWPLMMVLLPTRGVEAAALCVIAASACGLTMNYLFARRLLGVRASEVLAYYWRPAVACAVMTPAIAAYLDTIQALPGGRDGPLALAGGIAVGATVYLTTLFTFWRLVGRPEGAERTIVEWLGQRLGGKVEIKV